MPMLSAKPSSYNSSSALFLILQLKRLSLCFSAVGELKHSWTFFPALAFPASFLISKMTSRCSKFIPLPTTGSGTKGI